VRRSNTRYRYVMTIGFYELSPSIIISYVSQGVTYSSLYFGDTNVL